MLVIKNGRLIDPASKTDKITDLKIEGGKITSIGNLAREEGAEKNQPPVIEIDACGKWMVPGFIDMHTHLREPGEEYKETIQTGTRAAAAGGFTTVCCMPNTKPVNDNSSITGFIIEKAQSEGVVEVLPVAAITSGQQGEHLCEFGDLFQAGAIAFSDDGHPVMNSEVMRRALEYAGQFNRIIISHSEDLNLRGKGVMHEGEISTRLGLTGICSQVEEVMVARDIALAELTGTHLHLAHLSTMEAVRVLRQAKKRGVPVTAEVTPHHLFLTHTAVNNYNTYSKVNPPLRTEEDRLALIEALADGTIDVIATDHAPHSSVEKLVEYDLAAFGISGLETAANVVSQLVKDGFLTPFRAVEALTTAPAKILGLERGEIKIGARADITIFDPDALQIIEPIRFLSRGKNTPLAGKKLPGQILYTIHKGKVVYQAA